MSLGLLPIHATPAVKGLPLGRWAALAALLVAEVMLLTLRFDTATLTDESGLCARLLGQAHHLPHLAFAVAAAMLLFGGRRLLGELRDCAGQLDESGRAWPFVVAHLVVFPLFYQLTAQLMERDLAASSYAGAWVSAWFALGMATAGSLGLVALPGSVWLRLVRQTGRPLLVGALAGGAAWGLSLVTDRLWLFLAETTFWLVSRLLSLFCPEVICQPDTYVIGTPTFLVQISPECSGYEGMGLIWVFLGVYLWLFRRSLRFPQAWLLLPLGTATIYLANAGRIAGLIALGSWYSPEVATGGFHSQAGWLAFNGVALGMVALTRRLPFFCTTAPAPAARSVNPAAPYLAPLMALVAAVMVTTALSSGFDSLYPLRVLAVAVVFWWFRRQYTRMAWSWSWSAVGLGVAVFGLWLALESTTNAAQPEAGPPTDMARGWLVVWLCFRVVGSVVTVPLAEELAFRGYLMRRLQGADFEQVPPGRCTWLSFLVSSVLFGLLHGRWLAGTLAGMAFALALRRRGRLADAVVAHAVTNALLAVYVLATGTWSLWA